MRCFLSPCLLFLVVSTLFSETVGEALNIHVMRVSSYPVHSPDLPELRSDGGWADDGAALQHLDSLISAPPPGVFEVRISDSIYISHEHRYYDSPVEHELMLHPVTISNNTSDTLFFKAQDSQLNMKLQAKDISGLWQDIEYILHSDCGNSYHTRFLPPQHFWELSVPLFEGRHKTKLRLKLTYLPGLESEEKTMYSNEFEGSINPGQFWRKQQY